MQLLFLVIPTDHSKHCRAVLFAPASVMSDGQLSDIAAARVQANRSVCPSVVTRDNRTAMQNSTCSRTFELHYY